MATKHTPASPRKAYSYLRFSTPEQRKGDSERRQRQMAQAYATKHGLTLDDGLTFHDLGVSAFRGQNAGAGRLAYFLEAVHTGLVPQGSVLLVEQLDRLSRVAPRKAVEALGAICDAGVSVVTLNDEREYTSESLDNNPTDLLISVVTFMRANEESATKSRRLKQAWEAKREAAGSDKPLTGMAPAWLNVSLEAGTIELNEDRAAIVRRIFDMTLAGVGQHLIAETFNREGIKPWGRARFWQRSYIAKILANPAVVGTMTPHHMDYTSGVKSRKPLEALEGYFPAVVSPETFADVQALGASKRAPGRGKGGGAPLSNVLAGMAKCPLCNSTMTRVQKGARSRPSLVCVKAKAGAGCEYHSIPYAYIEMAILERLSERLRDVPAGGPGNDDDEQAILNLSEQQDALRHKARTLLDNLSFERSPALVARLRETETELEAVTATLSALLERREVTSGPLIGNRVGRVLDLLCPEPPEGRLADLEDNINRAALNAALRGIFTRAVINWSNGTVEFEWTHGGTTELPFMWAR
ncbi:MAG: hypothetical protein B7Y43_03565 [Sphingomonas sp. 28-62-20]|uniref:recombinase family protein n=1 Tax=Sphingomonas sp. 28-62-20 TaxID=1970433 RepID=UPI000BD19D6C|nr:MAG: hypothetical protein B7Y43_03565 [Sphingomonas sp. 28-62-20]